MKEERTTMPASANSLATSDILRMFSSLSSGLKLRFLFRPIEREGGRGRENVHTIQKEGEYNFGQ